MMNDIMLKIKRTLEKNNDTLLLSNEEYDRYFAILELFNKAYTKAINTKLWRNKQSNK